MKQVIIGIWYKGKRHPFLVSAFFQNGKVKVSQDTIEECLDSVGVKGDDVYSIQY